MNKKEIDRIQSCIDHIQTASDVDPWAKELSKTILEKQLPKAPQYREAGIFCSDCDSYIRTSDMFCASCGRRQDWGGKHC